MKPEPADGSPFSRPCPFVEVPLIWKGPGRAFCEHCSKDVHDLRGRSLVEVARFMRSHPGVCIMMGPAARTGDPVEGSP